MFYFFKNQNVILKKGFYFSHDHGSLRITGYIFNDIVPFIVYPKF